MYKDYDEAIREVGKFKIKKIGNNKYVHICYDKNGKEYIGPVFTKKERHQKSKKVEKKKKNHAKYKTDDKELQKLKDFFDARRHASTQNLKDIGKDKDNKGNKDKKNKKNN